MDGADYITPHPTPPQVLLEASRGVDASFTYCLVFFFYFVTPLSSLQLGCTLCQLSIRLFLDRKVSYQNFLSISPYKYLSFYLLEGIL